MSNFLKKYQNDIAVFLQYIVVIEIFGFVGRHYNFLTVKEILWCLAGAVFGFLIEFTNFSWNKNPLKFVFLVEFLYFMIELVTAIF